MAQLGNNIQIFIHATGNMNEALEKVNLSFVELNRVMRSYTMKVYNVSTLLNIQNKKIEYGTTNLDEIMGD